MLKLDDSQQAAVDQISQLVHPVYLLIGAGGSGKTFTIQHLLQQLWDDEGNEITPESTYLAAPTGKASKVLNDAFLLAGFEVENEAKTVHRLLDYNPGLGWGYNYENKLKASLVIVDEASMVDSLLLSKVIDALPDDCHLILVGDENQLPPVAPGQPFTDIINFGPKEIVNKLTTNHRQAQGSLIADGCLRVLAGEKPVFGIQGEHTLKGPLVDDMFLLQEDEKEDIPERVAELCRPWHEQGLDYAILSPQRTGVVGVEKMNAYLQEKLNPHRELKNELKIAAWLTIREGDKVLQTKNNYALEVFNGFCGTVLEIDPDAETILVDFDGQHVFYEEKKHILDLALGFCMTVHKSQGSSFSYGAVVCHSSHFYMWNRSLFYTAISRFRRQLYVVGDQKAIKRSISNVVSGERNTLIKLELRKKSEERLCEQE